MVSRIGALAVVATLGTAAFAAPASAHERGWGWRGGHGRSGVYRQPAWRGPAWRAPYWRRAYPSPYNVYPGYYGNYGNYRYEVTPYPYPYSYPTY